MIFETFGIDGHVDYLFFILYYKQKCCNLLTVILEFFSLMSEINTLWRERVLIHSFGSFPAPL